DSAVRPVSPCACRTSCRSLPARSSRSVPVLLRKAEAARRSLLGVELDQHGLLVADDPGVVTRLDRDHLRRRVVEGTAVGVLAGDVAAGEEADVGVHAELGADARFHVRRPAEARRVDGSLQAAVPDGDEVDLRTADLAMGGAFDCGGERVGHAGTLAWPENLRELEV